jgi:hypothetical protein
VPKRLFKSPEQFVKAWPEVFEGLYMNTMPVAYIKLLKLEFQNGRVWEIDIQEQLVESSPDLIADKILETFDEYRDEISRVDFAIDIERLKNEITKGTRDLF